MAALPLGLKLHVHDLIQVLEKAANGAAVALSSAVVQINGKKREGGNLALRFLLRGPRPQTSAESAADAFASEESETVLDQAPAWEKELKLQMAAWNADPDWVDEPLHVEVTVPRPCVCELNCQFRIGLPPDAVFSILLDPENCRIFKNIKEVSYRRVLEDAGQRQVVELQQAAIWRFLFLSGTFAVHLMVTQDRPTRHVRT
eukprot:TRINITY_DN4774_c0_g3_i2.p1 TRINITY_DN4774_c0_g3~~TRINITY_DN4774_c0_g3_i2.p1  ORF type:complete len:202 (-),score=53.17 TRINITY_DN4774_c0_g3_i2:154-759(-)